MFSFFPQKKSGKNSSIKKSRYFTRRDKAFVSPKPIDKHGDYDGTDVGFTSKSIQDPKPSKPREHIEKKPIDKHANYEGTDAGFTADFKK